MPANYRADPLTAECGDSTFEHVRSAQAAALIATMAKTAITQSASKVGTSDCEKSMLQT